MYIEFNVKTYSMLEYWKNSNCKLCTEIIKRIQGEVCYFSHIAKVCYIEHVTRGTVMRELENEI